LGADLTGETRLKGAEQAIFDLGIHCALKISAPWPGKQELSPAGFAPPLGALHQQLAALCGSAFGIALL
jgi:hypothetical protein